MRASVKVGLVAGGYAAALAIAFAMVAIYIVLTDGPDRQGIRRHVQLQRQSPVPRGV